MSQEENDREAEKRAYIDEIKATYSGIRRFVDMARIRETGETRLLFFDLDRDELNPVYFTAIHPRDILICGGQGMIFPALTYEHWMQWQETGKPPEGEGYILANNYRTAPPPHTDDDAPQDEATL